MKLPIARSLPAVIAAIALIALVGYGGRSQAPPASKGLSARWSVDRLVSGSTLMALQLMGAHVGKARPMEPPEEPPSASFDAAIGAPVAGPGISGGPPNVVPQSSDVLACLVHFGNNIKVNTDCENASDPPFHGRAQAHNETAIAANPFNPDQVIAEQNDYRFGDGSCGADFSLNGGKTWGNLLVPTKFSIDPNTNKREYWEGSGDPAVAWDSSGTAFYLCMAFNRGAPVTNNPDTKSTIFVFRSDNKGASVDFPGSRGGAKGQVTYQLGGTPPFGLPLADKPYLAIDANPGSPFKDYLYVSWTLFDTDNTAKIYVNRSRDHGETWDGNKLVSGSSTLCPDSVVGANNCDANQFSDPVVGPDGNLYVLFDDYNNHVTGAENRNQILLAKSTDGGATFGPLIKVADYYDLPACAPYTGGQDFGRACVPIKAPADTAHQPSVFRATNYPSAVVDPRNPSRLLVHFGSYINSNSRESNGCAPDGLAADGNNKYTGVTTAGACNNRILVSESANGGATFTGTTTDPRALPLVSGGGDKTDQFWQWSAVTHDGTVGVSFYDRRYGDDETTGKSDISIAIRGHTSRVTSTSMPPPTQFPNTYFHGLFYGDYSGLSAAGDAFLPFWMDTRDIGITSCPSNPRQLCSFGNQQDVFVAKVNVVEGEDQGDSQSG